MVFFVVREFEMDVSIHGVVALLHTHYMTHTGKRRTRANDHHELADLCWQSSSEA